VEEVAIILKFQKEKIVHEIAHVRAHEKEKEISMLQKKKMKQLMVILV
jgi:hypothetical protein